MRLKLAGTLSTGMRIDEIINDNKASKPKYGLGITENEIIEYVEVDKPLIGSTNGVFEGYDLGGTAFLCAGSAGDGLQFYGPFGDDDCATSYGDQEFAHTEWSVWTFSEPKLKLAM